MQYNKNTRKGFGIQNLTLILIFGYAIGYILLFLYSKRVSPVLEYITLDPYKILQGEVWRLFTWLLVPPQLGFSPFTLLMLYFYYQIGTLLERIWGTVKYTKYILGGIIITIISAFLMLAYYKYIGGYSGEQLAFKVAENSIRGFSTYYINLAIFVGYAATFPDMRVLFMFVIPIKIKVLAIIDILVLIGEFFYTPYPGVRFAIGAALINIAIFLLTSKVAIDPKQFVRRQEFKREVKQATKMQAPTRHKCAVCGRTDETNPELEFRYCSKCNGNYEYCQDHLFTHEHVK